MKTETNDNLIDQLAEQMLKRQKEDGIEANCSLDGGEDCETCSG